MVTLIWISLQWFHNVSEARTAHSILGDIWTNRRTGSQQSGPRIIFNIVRKNFFFLRHSIIMTWNLTLMRGRSRDDELYQKEIGRALKEIHFHCKLDMTFTECVRWGVFVPFWLYFMGLSSLPFRSEMWIRRLHIMCPRLLTLTKFNS